MIFVISSCSPTKKGDGTHFYVQYEGNNAIYHSINDCENITSFDIDVYNTDKTPSFCAKCMDDSLVSKCKVKIEQIKEIKEKDQQAKIEEANKVLDFKRYTNKETGLSFEYPTVCKLIQEDGDDEQYNIVFESKDPDLSISLTRYWNRQCYDAKTFEKEQKMSSAKYSLRLTLFNGENVYLESNDEGKSHFFRKVMFRGNYYYEAFIIYDGSKKKLCNPAVTKMYTTLMLNGKKLGSK